MADWRTGVLSDRLPSQHPRVAIVGINDQALSEFKTRIPIDRGLLAKVIDAVDAAGAKVIGIDILFLRPAPGDHEADADRRHPAGQGQGGAGGRRRADRPEPAKEIDSRSACLPRPGGRPAM